MATPEQRREVAERLREDASCSERSPRFVIESYLGIEYDGTDVLEESYKSESLLHLADLIDPTCKPVVDDAHDMDDELVCSECGCFLAIVVDGKPSEPLYRYCPVCGARIVRDE